MCSPQHSGCSQTNNTGLAGEVWSVGFLVNILKKKKIRNPFWRHKHMSLWVNGSNETAGTASLTATRRGFLHPWYCFPSPDADHSISRVRDLSGLKTKWRKTKKKETQTQQEKGKIHSWCRPEAAVQAELRQWGAGMAPGEGETRETGSTTNYSVSWNYRWNSAWETPVCTSRTTNTEFPMGHSWWCHPWRSYPFF